MKKAILALTFLMVCVLCFAKVNDVKAVDKLIKVVEKIKMTAKNSATTLGNEINKGQDIITIWNNAIDNQDKQKMQNLKTKVNAAKNALDDVITYIEAEWDALD